MVVERTGAMAVGEGTGEAGGWGGGGRERKEVEATRLEIDWMCEVRGSQSQGLSSWEDGCTICSGKEARRMRTHGWKWRRSLVWCAVGLRCW